MTIGARYRGDRTCEFTVWAPQTDHVELQLHSPTERIVPLHRGENGYWTTVVDAITPATTYQFKLGPEIFRPDPASHFQPEGVHGASAVVDHRSFDWQDEAWKGIALDQMIMYELHVGTFTPAGTFDAIIPRLHELHDIGINAIELMPVAQFPGERNWGYDGVYPFAVQNSYGGPDGLKRLVNTCHASNIAVILDVVYNHLGPEGNHFADFGPYFSQKYRTPWGAGLNFDGPHSDDVRNFFIENALYWFREYHIDALRLDAIHAIFDNSARPFLAELAERVEKYSNENGRRFHLIAETNLNDPKILAPRSAGGYGIDAQWLDDLHHGIHALLTGERDGFYADYGKLDQIIKCLKEGYVLSGQYSRYRKRRHGGSSADRTAKQFVVCTKNHDLVGNRAQGERMSSLVSFEAMKLQAALTLLSPYIPMIFMGDEYGEESPFLYFVSHSDEQLVEAVRKGRRQDFKAFSWKEEPPDPQSPDTFVRSKLHWERRMAGKHRVMLDFFSRLTQLRREMPSLSNLDNKSLAALSLAEGNVLMMRRWNSENGVCAFFNFDTRDSEMKIDLTGGKWTKVLDSSEKRWSGPGSPLLSEIRSPETITMRPHSAALFVRENHA